MTMIICSATLVTILASGFLPPPMLAVTRSVHLQGIQDQQALFADIDRNRARHLDFLQSLIRASVDGEEAVQTLVAERFEQLGLEVQTLSLLPTRLNLDLEFAAEETIDMVKRISVLGRLEGDGMGKSLLFFAHPDGEPITDESTRDWKHDPFAAEIDDGRIYGWGVADDLAGVAIMAEALSAVLETVGRPQGNIYLGSTPAKRNARGILALLNEGLQADASVYLHPAESEQGLKDIKAITSGMLQLRITVFGAPPDTKEPGQTAFAHMATNAVHMANAVVESLLRLDEERARRVHHAALERAVGRSTNLLVSHIACGEGNRLTRVPTECVIGASVTFPPNEDLADVQDDLMTALSEVSHTDTWPTGQSPSVEWLFGTQGVEVPPEHPLYETVHAAVQLVTGQEPEVNPLHSASDIRNPTLFRGIPTVGIGPLAGDLTQAGGHDEWVDVEDYIRAIKICAKIIADWSG
jgi:acetylornithine deacetylase